MVYTCSQCNKGCNSFVVTIKMAVLIMHKMITFFVHFESSFHLSSRRVKYILLISIHCID